METALVDPHVRPSGILAQPSMVRYGLGRPFVGAMVACAHIGEYAAIVATVVHSTRAVQRMNRLRSALGVASSYGWLFNSVISFSCSMLSLSACFPAGKWFCASTYARMSASCPRGTDFGLSGGIDV